MRGACLEAEISAGLILGMDGLAYNPNELFPVKLAFALETPHLVEVHMGIPEVVWVIGRELFDDAFGWGSAGVHQVAITDRQPCVDAMLLSLRRQGDTALLMLSRQDVVGFFDYVDRLQPKEEAVRTFDACFDKGIKEILS